MANKAKERRRHKRRYLVLEVELLDPPLSEPEYLTNLSEGGTFILTNHPFLNDQPIHFAISSPRLAAPVEKRGIVRWRRAADSRAAGGVGVELVHDDDADLERWREILAKIG